MPNKAMEELLNLSIDELNTKVSEITSEINKLSQLSIDKVKERSAMKGLRHQRARALTVINQKKSA